MMLVVFACGFPSQYLNIVALNIILDFNPKSVLKQHKNFDEIPVTSILKVTALMIFDSGVSFVHVVEHEGTTKQFTGVLFFIGHIRCKDVLSPSLHHPSGSLRSKSTCGELTESQSV